MDFFGYILAKFSGGGESEFGECSVVAGAGEGDNMVGKKDKQASLGKEVAVAGAEGSVLHMGSLQLLVQALCKEVAVAGAEGSVGKKLTSNEGTSDKQGKKKEKKALCKEVAVAGAERSVGKKLTGNEGTSDKQGKKEEKKEAGDTEERKKKKEDREEEQA